MNDGVLENNLFAYCSNNPVNLLDPDGTNPFIVAFAAIGLFNPGVLTAVAIVTLAILAVGIAYKLVEFYHLTQRDTDEDDPYSIPEDSPNETETPSNDESEVGDSVGDVGNNDADVVEVQLSDEEYPETAQHIQDAIADGQLETLTINRENAVNNRKVSLRGIKKVPGKDLDEYLPAMFDEGGSGVSVRAIGRSDNRGSGSVIGHALRKYPNGTKVRIIFNNNGD